MGVCYGGDVWLTCDKKTETLSSPRPAHTKAGLTEVRPHGGHQNTEGNDQERELWG